MKQLKTVSILLVALLVTQAACAQDVSGVWRLKTRFGNRTRISMLRLTRQDGQLTGVLFRRPGEGTAIEDARLEQGRLSFAISRVFRNQKFTTRYEGELEGTSIAGSAEFQRRDQTMTFDWTAERSDEAALAAAEELPKIEADLELVDENYELWRDHILPEVSEMAWAKIPWLTTFKDGVLAADAADKPLLFWTMNGHPLGCT